MRRTGSGTRFPPIALLESAKLWQKSYYVRNLHPTRDYINLLAYVAAPRLSLATTGGSNRGRCRLPSPTPSSGFKR